MVGRPARPELDRAAASTATTIPFEFLYSFILTGYLDRLSRLDHSLWTISLLNETDGTAA